MSMSVRNSFTLTQSEREYFAKLADFLIPPKEGAFSASEAGIADHLLGLVEEFAPERLPLLRKVSQHAAQSTVEEALISLKEHDRPAYDVFCETVAAVYFMSSDVRRHIGFPGREAVVAKTDIADLEALLLPVLEGDFKPRI